WRSQTPVWERRPPNPAPPRSQTPVWERPSLVPNCLLPPRSQTPVWERPSLLADESSLSVRFFQQGVDLVPEGFPFRALTARQVVEVRQANRGKVLVLQELLEVNLAGGTMGVKTLLQGFLLRLDEILQPGERLGSILRPVRICRRIAAFSG